MVDVGSDPLAVFSPATATWFREVFARPTTAQAGAWQAVAAGENALVVAPTGSGKTLAAFLWALDDLTRSPVPSAKERCRVLYVSPLKALAVDVERNLRAPLAGITQTALRLDQTPPNVTVGVRSGDTSPADRRALVTRPPDILITTPESLFLMLTSAARDLLRSVRTVIVDEVHALAGTKRGAHLALSLERLEALTAESQAPDSDGVLRPLQRIGLSATVRPAERVAAYLGGSYPVRVVAPPAEKAWDLSIVVPVEDMSDLAASASTPAPTPSLDEDRPPPRTPSIWPHVENRILDVINAHRSTIVFANSRRLAERLTAHLNELQAERLGEETVGVLAACGDHGAVRCLVRPGRFDIAGDRPGAPRVGEQGAAGPDRERPEVRTAALRRRHVVVGARDRHGRGRRGGSGRGPTVGGQRAATRRAGRSPGRGDVARRVLPQPSR